MEVELVNQGPGGSGTLGQRLRELADDEQLGAASFRAASAYISEKGVAILIDVATRIRRRSGTVDVILGYDPSQTRSQTLRGAVDRLRAGSVYIVGATNVRFHPKLYIFAGLETTVSIIGSANATQAGLETNWECCCVIRCRQDEKPLLDQLSQVWDGYMSYAVPLNEEWLDRYEDELQWNDVQQVLGAVGRWKHPFPRTATRIMDPRARTAKDFEAAFTELYNKVTAYERDRTAQVGGILPGSDWRIPACMVHKAPKKGISLAAMASHLGYRDGESLAAHIAELHEGMKTAKALKSAEKLAIGPAECCELAERIRSVAIEMQPEVDPQGLGIYVYVNDKGKWEAGVNLHPLRSLGQGHLADDLVSRLRRLNENKPQREKNWPTVPCDALYRNWLVARADVIEPYLQARMESRLAATIATEP